MADKKEDSQIDLYVRVTRVVPDDSTFIFTPISFEIYMTIKNEQNLYKGYKMSNLDRASFDQAIISLCRQGLLQEEEKIPEQYIDRDDIERIKSNLITFIGPWGHLVFNDTLEVLGLSKEKVPELKMPLLINSIIDQIPPTEALRFKESVKDITDGYA
jgi:hypothetical protein